MTLVTVTTTVETRDAAASLAKQLVNERLAACVQIARIESVYRWDGIQCDEEFRLDCKTTRDRSEALVAQLAAIHPYDEPEIILTPVEASPGYAAWAVEAVRPGSDAGA